jgi:hypothetical protein
MMDVTYTTVAASYRDGVVQVFLKEHSRGLYSTFLYWLLSQLPLYILKSVSAVIFGVVVYALLALGLDTGTMWL